MSSCSTSCTLERRNKPDYSRVFDGILREVRGALDVFPVFESRTNLSVLCFKVKTNGQVFARDFSNVSEAGRRDETPGFNSKVQGFCSRLEET
jgi:hypothetical protein